MPRAQEELDARNATLAGMLASGDVPIQIEFQHDIHGEVGLAVAEIPSIIARLVTSARSAAAGFSTRA